MNATGTRGELLVAEKLIKLGFHVSIPLDETQFDLICTLKEKSHRIQVKCTGGIEKAKQPTILICLGVTVGRSHTPMPIVISLFV